MMERLPLWARKCPVCGVRQLRPALVKVLWEEPAPTLDYRCDNCRALFNYRRGKRYELTFVKNTTHDFWLKYHHQPKTTAEWNEIVRPK